MPSALPDSIRKLAKLSPRKDNLETVTATSLGWLRRTDLDHGDSIHWELPTGTVYAYGREKTDPMLIRITKPDQDKLVWVVLK